MTIIAGIVVDQGIHGSEPTRKPTQPAFWPNQIKFGSNMWHVILLPREVGRNTHFPTLTLLLDEIQVGPTNLKMGSTWSGGIYMFSPNKRATVEKRLLKASVPSTPLIFIMFLYKLSYTFLTIINLFITVLVFINYKNWSLIPNWETSFLY